jgi:hypothetical protein
MLSSGMKSYHLGYTGANVIIWDELLSFGMKYYLLELNNYLGQNVINWDEMLSSGANVIIRDKILSSGMQCYHLELMLSSGMKYYCLGCNVIMWS